MASPEIACVYAALILNDDNIPLTHAKIFSLLNAANIKIESYLIDLFIEYFQNHDISDLIKRTNLRNPITTSIPEETEKKLMKIIMTMKKENKEMKKKKLKLVDLMIFSIKIIILIKFFYSIMNWHVFTFVIFFYKVNYKH